MHPGSFILHDAIEAWHTGQSKKEIRNAAGKANILFDQVVSCFHCKRAS